MKRRKEILGFILLLVLGLVPRLAFVTRFPTIPVSDFHSLVWFGLDLRDHGLTHHSAGWEYLNPGLPLILSALFRLAPSANPELVARLATALATGLLAILPFIIWRGVLPFWVRALAGAALAVWPGQILFTGTVAQDNWVMLPTVALGALAVRSLLTGQPAQPIIAGLLYVAGVAMRQEMLVALLPLFLGATLVRFRPGWRRAAAATLAAGVPLLMLVVYRHASTGRLAFSSEAAGSAILSSYIPGSNANAYMEPFGYIASVRPDLLRERNGFYPYAARLAFQEALRRPAFHAVRILSWVCNFAVAGEARSLYWSLGGESLPEALRSRGSAIALLAVQPLRLELAAIQGLFLAAVIIAIRRRNRAILVLASAVLLKYGLHAVTAVQGRYFYPATALELLAIAVAAYEVGAMFMGPERWWWLRALAAGLAFSLGLLLFAPRLDAFVQSRDVDQQRTYYFRLPPLQDPLGQFAALDCVVGQGTLDLMGFPSATIRTFRRKPAAGDAASARCELTGSKVPRPLMLQILDPYAPGGLPDRMTQRVELDGVEIYSHNITQAPWSGWANIPLGDVEMGAKRSVAIEMKAIHPDPSVDWGSVATTFRLAESSFASHLAVGKPAAQSSTLPGYATTGAMEAIDGNTDGSFFAGSVTSTNRDTNAWWQVDLGASKAVGSIVIWNRTDCCSSRLNDYWVFLSDTPFSPSDTPATLQKRAGIWKSHQTAAPDPSTAIRTAGAKGRYVRVQLSGTDYLSLAEVQVFGQ
jgi:hypothetical protein